MMTKFISLIHANLVASKTKDKFMSVFNKPASEGLSIEHMIDEEYN